MISRTRSIQFPMTHLYRQVAVAAAMMLAALIATPAIAQVAAPPENPTIDGHQVNLPTGDVIMQRPGVSIGPAGHHGLSLSEYYVGNGWRYSELPTISGSSQTVVISFMGTTSSFANAGSGSYTPTYENGATLSYASGSGTYSYTGPDGTQITFVEAPGGANSELYLPGVSGLASPTQVTFTDGVVWNYHFRTDSWTSPPCSGPECLPGDGGVTFHFRRLESITSNTGFQIKLDYQTDSISSQFGPGWHTITSIDGINNAVEYCNPTGDCSGLTGNWPSATYANGDVTNDAGDTVDYEYNGPGGRISAITRPGGANDTVQITYDSANRVASVLTGGGTWTYTYTSTSTTTTNPEGGTTVTSFNAEGQVASRTVAGQTTTFGYCASDTATCREGLLQSVETPEGQTTTYAYDLRGNVEQVTSTDKNDANPITTRANYVGNCANPVTCNKPNWTQDAAGQYTNYDYDPVHGGVTRVRAPRANANEQRATTHIEYTTAQARYLTGPGNWTTSAPITVPLRQRSCRTGGTCTGSVNEARTTLAYPSSGTPNNLQPVSVTTSLGDGSQAATSTFTYTDLGQPESVDGPLAGTGDTSTIIYDQYNRRIGTVSGDPDGTGPLPRLASRITIANGLVTRQESGTTTTTGATALTSSFTPDQRADIQYDDLGRPIRQRHRQVGTATQYSVVQTSYNAMGLVECVAQRMNAPLTTTSLPSPCTVSAAGLDGSDRISRTVYDDYGRVIERRAAVGTTLEQVTQRFAYHTGAAQNGQLDWVEDAEGNRTQYLYDDFGRHYRTNYPDTATANTANPNDYDEVTFDSAGRIATFINRAGVVQTFARDLIGRITSVTDPGRTDLDSTHSRNTYYGYDLFGNLEYARFDSHTGEGITNTWNALGQLEDTTNNMDGASRTLSYGYDVAGRRTGLTHPDAVQFIYDFDPLGRLTSINRSTHQVDLLAWTYGADGRVASRMAEASAPDVTYGFDAAGRLSDLLVDHPSGTTYDADYDFTFNPAGQVTSEAQGNGLYAFGDHANVDLDYTVNGLNQYTAIEGQSYTHDASGNTTSDGTTNWTYDNNNRLVEAVDVATGTEKTVVRYDPLGRMYEVVYDADTSVGGTNSTRRLYYDGHDLVLEYDANGAMLHRYVHGVSGGDDPLVQWNGSSASLSGAQYLYSDMRGSIVGIYNRNGTAIEINAYDEFGTPDQDNGGRFQFTGQQYVPELGLYYYKARMYSFRQGRFMQTDPIGYADGMNMYAYVGNDPVNGVDPFGLCTIHTTTTYHWWVPRYDDGSEGTPQLYDITYSHEKEGCDPQPNVDPADPGRDGGGPRGKRPRKEEEDACPEVPDEIPSYLYVPLGLLLTGDIIHERSNAAAAQRFPNLGGTDDARDAYRHTWAAIAVSRLYGPARALGAGNVNEVQGYLRGLMGQSGYNAASRAMDDHNNYVGAVLGADDRYSNMSTTELTDYAFTNDCVVTSP